MNIENLLTALEQQYSDALKSLASLAEADKDDFFMINLHHGEYLHQAYGALKLCQSYLNKAGHTALAEQVMKEWTDWCDKFWEILNKYRPVE